mgnify:CR=1 FL=1
MSTLKKDLILKFSCMPTLPELANNHLLLVTATGVISGDIITDSESDTALSILAKVSKSIADDYKNDEGTTDSLDGNDGFIALKNVTIKSSNCITTLDFLNVFFDQIIGVSIGKI